MDIPLTLSAETPIKLIYAGVWCAVVFPLLSKSVYRYVTHLEHKGNTEGHCSPTPTSMELLIDYAERLYLYGFPVLQFLVSVVHPLYFGRLPSDPAYAQVVEGPEAMGPPAKPAMEFLPLMATSVYCAIGISWAWLRLSYLYTTRA